MGVDHTLCQVSTNGKQSEKIMLEKVLEHAWEAGRLGGGGMLMRKNEEVYWNFNYKDITLRT